MVVAEGTSAGRFAHEMVGVAEGTSAGSCRVLDGTCRFLLFSGSMSLTIFREPPLFIARIVPVVAN